jgi:glutamate--cysteine ligase
MQVFMLFCLFEESENIRPGEWKAMNRNHHQVSLWGRKPQLMLERYDKRTMNLKQWAHEIFQKLRMVAAIMDAPDQQRTYQDCIDAEYKKVLNASLLPSAFIYKEMNAFNEGHAEFGLRWAQHHKRDRLVRS